MAYRQKEQQVADTSIRSGIPMSSSSMKNSALRTSTLQRPPSRSDAMPPPPPPAAPLRGPRKSNFGAPVAATRSGASGSSSQQQQQQQLYPSAASILGSSQAGPWDQGRTPMKSSTANNAYGTSAGAASVNRRSTMLGQSAPASGLSGGGNVIPPGSVARGRTPSATIPNNASSTLRDVRPVRDGGWQKAAQADLYKYLMEVKTDQELTFLTPTTLRSPTTKQFEEVWRFLVVELDPDWVPPAHSSNAERGGRGNQQSGAPRVEEYFVETMRDLGYPFADGITKSILSAINSPHSWAQITAALHWMLNMASCKATWLFNEVVTDPYLMNADEINPLADAPEIRHVLEFDFLAKSYTKYLLEAGDTDFADEEDRFQERYRARLDAQDEAASQQENASLKIEQQIAELTSKPSPRQNAQKERDEAAKYLSQLEAGIAECEPKIAKYLHQCQAYRRERDGISKEMSRLRTEQARIIQILKAQNLTPDDIARITAEESTLKRTLESLSQTVTASTRARDQLEVGVTLKAERMDELIGTYRALLTACGLFPPPAPESLDDSLRGVQLDLNLDTAQPDPARMMDVDIRGTLRPAIAAFRAGRAHARVELEAKLDDLVQALESLQSQAGERAERIREHDEHRVAIEQSIETARAMMNEEVERSRVANLELERSARAIEDALNAGRGASSAELKNREIELENLKGRVGPYTELLKDRITSKVKEMLEIIALAGVLLKDFEDIVDASEQRTLALATGTGVIGTGTGITDAAAAAVGITAE